MIAGFERGDTGVPPFDRGAIVAEPVLRGVKVLADEPDELEGARVTGAPRVIVPARPDELPEFRVTVR